MWLTPASPHLPFDVILTCADRPADQTNVIELQKEVAGKGTCYTLIKKKKKGNFMCPKGSGQAMKVHALHRAGMTKASPPAGRACSCAPASAVASVSMDSGQVGSCTAGSVS